MPGALDGFRIVDFTQVISGPLATRLLGDQGADVIKVEPPGGDILRHMGGVPGLSPTFATVNRSKRSVVLDLKRPSGGRGAPAAGRERRRLRAERPAGDRRSPGHRRRNAPRETSAAGLRLDQRLRRAGSLRAEARLRPHRAGHVRTVRHPGRHRRTAPPRPGDRPGQGDRADRGPEHHRRAARPRAHRPGPAPAALHAGRGDRLRLARGHGLSHLHRRGSRPASSRCAPRPRLRHARWPRDRVDRKRPASSRDSAARRTSPSGSPTRASRAPPAWSRTLRSACGSWRKC